MDEEIVCQGREIISKVTNVFTVWDYVVFGAALVISASIGVYFGWVDRNKGSAEYMMGGGGVSPFPIACSLATTFFSAVTVLGTPAEYYIYGTMFTYFLITYLFCSILIAELFGPIYKNLGIVSIYEYLEARFGRSVRLHLSFIFIVQSLLYISIVIYGPALALETVTGLDRWLAVWVSGAVCIFYTSIGGLKAVVWTDTLQILLMLMGFLSIIIEGSVSFGGFSTIIERAEQGGRFIWNDFSFDPRQRHTFWSVVFGGTFGIWGSFFCVTQSYTQRMLACRTMGEMRIAVYFGYLGIVLILILAALTGLVAFAHYQCCDPLDASWISSRDQLIPYLAVDRFRDHPGAASLFVVGAYAGTLSTVSSGVNSMATVFISDFVKPYEAKIACFNATERNYTILVKLSSVIFGVICISLTYMVDSLGSGILQAALSINGILGGPTLAIFFMGVLMPPVNKWGVHLGYLIGAGLAIWNYIGSSSYPPSADHTRVLERSTYSCDPNDLSRVIPRADNISSTSSGLASFYSLSYMYLGTLAFVGCMIPSIIISFATGGQPNVRPETIRNVFSFMPPRFQRWITCGVHPNNESPRTKSAVEPL